MYRRKSFADKNTEYEILFEFIDELTCRCLIVYINYHINEFGETELFASEVMVDKNSGNSDEVTLLPIVSQEDSARVRMEIQKFLSASKQKNF